MSLREKIIGEVESQNYLINDNRKNIGTRATERKLPAVVVMDEAGIMLNCCNSFEKLFGYTQSELISMHISRLFPEFAQVTLIYNGTINERLHYISHCGHVFTGWDKQGKAKLTKLSLICLEYKGIFNLRMLVRPYNPFMRQSH
jgi:PAS domain S-box-containing protein